MNIDIKFQSRKVLVQGQLKQGTAILYTITADDGSVTRSLTNTWEVLAASPYNIGREREAWLRRQRPGFYRETEMAHGRSAE